MNGGNDAAAAMHEAFMNAISVGWDVVGLLMLAAFIIYGWSRVTRIDRVNVEGGSNRQRKSSRKTSRTRSAAERAGFRVIDGSKE